MDSPRTTPTQSAAISVAVYPIGARPGGRAAARDRRRRRPGLPVVSRLLGLADHPLRLIRNFAAICVVPEIAARALRRLYRGELSVGDESLVIERARAALHIPLESIRSVAPWALPLPGCGIDLRVGGDAPSAYAIETKDLGVLLDRLGSAVERRPDGLAVRSAVAYARARSAVPSRWWSRPLFKFAVFSVLPTIPLFRVHQIIAYGGTFGEYYQYGIGSYLAGFAIYWATLAIYLILLAAALRLPSELVAIGAAVAAPKHAARVRLAVRARGDHRVLRDRSDRRRPALRPLVAGAALYLPRIFVARPRLSPGRTTAIESRTETSGNHCPACVSPIVKR